MENARRTSHIFHDRPQSALDTAIFWTEYVIRHGGAPHLQSAAVKLAWYQYPVAYPGIFFGGVQQIQLRTEVREDGDLGAVAP